jgi:hypothetical protein
MESEYYIEELKAAVKSISYDFDTKIGNLYMPDMCCTDMSGCIAFFQRIDPRVESIYTFSNGVRDTSYHLRGGEWRANTAHQAY